MVATSIRRGKATGNAARQTLEQVRRAGANATNQGDDLADRRFYFIHYGARQVGDAISNFREARDRASEAFSGIRQGGDQLVSFMRYLTHLGYRAPNQVGGLGERL